MPVLCYSFLPLNVDCGCIICVCCFSFFSEFRLRVCLFYQGQKVQDFTTSTPGGCWISHGPVPAEDERAFGPRAAEQLRFPLPEIIRATGHVCEVMGRLLPHLQRGVRVWVTQDGIFIKRFCQGRVYWGGPLAQHQDRPNKLEREKTCKVLDVYVFLQGINLNWSDLRVKNADARQTGPFSIQRNNQLSNKYETSCCYWQEKCILYITDTNTNARKTFSLGILESISCPFCLFPELRLFLQGAGPKPKFRIDLCFGEEYPEPIESKAKKLITAEVSVSVTYGKSLSWNCCFYLWGRTSSVISSQCDCVGQFGF